MSKICSKRVLLAFLGWFMFSQLLTVLVNKIFVFCVVFFVVTFREDKLANCI